MSDVTSTTISMRVDEIIARRKAKLPKLMEKKQLLNNLKEALSSFELECREIFMEDGTLKESKYQKVLNKYPEIAVSLSQISVTECKKRVDRALEDCDVAIRRFSRENINISVIGKARIGKSEFLKGLSDLSNYVIPAFSESDCTGAVSIISNSPDPMRAHLEFKSEREIIDTVQEYLDALIPDEAERIHIYALSQIRDLKMEDVEKRMVSGRADNILLKYLRKYVEHYAEWAPLVASGSITLMDEKTIQTYVAQNNGERDDALDEKGIPKRREYYKYLAVKLCHISCPYNYKEAGKISLIDTVGFEDNSLGIEEELLNVVSNKSDAVVFMLFPLDLGGGGVPAKIRDIYNKIEVSCRGKNLDKWLFWLINYAPNHPVTPNTEHYCKTTLKTLKENKWHGELMKIVDAHDQDQVREEFLIPLLEILTNGLEETDQLFLKDLKDSLRAVRSEYNNICTMANKIFSGSANLGGDVYVTILQENERLFRTISAKLKEVCLERKEYRELECQELEDEIDRILNSESSECGGFIPQIDEIEAMIKGSGQQNLTIYVNYCNSLRNRIVSRFATLDVVIGRLLMELKDQVTDILLHDGRLENILATPEEGERYEWLKEFSDQYLDTDTYPHLKEAFDNLYAFELSVNGFLTYEVRACLDKLDPDIGGTPVLTGTDSYKIAKQIRLALDHRLRNSFMEELRDRLQELVIKPNRAMFAAVTDFRDTVIYSENVKMEWQTLFLNNARELWNDIFALSAGNSAVSQELQTIVDGLVRYNGQADNFKLLV